MNQEVKTKWLEALRSGKYEQATGHLRSEGEDTEGEGFCCLGVLCEVSKELGLELAIGKTKDLWTYNGESTLIPREVQAFAGLEDTDPFIESHEYVGYEVCTLAQLSDQGAPFSLIADVIEQEL